MSPGDLRTGLLPHQQRVIAEYADLEERRRRLASYIWSPEFQKNELTIDERHLMLKQHGLMLRLAAVLRERMHAFGVD